MSLDSPPCRGIGLTQQNEYYFTGGHQTEHPGFSLYVPNRLGSEERTV
jgi:hypothetical protein